MSGWLFDFSIPNPNWEIETAVEVQAELADDLEGDELRVARHLLGEWATEPGGLTAKLDEVERMSRAEKREGVAAAYRELGLETPEERREHRRFVAANRALRPPPPPRCVVCGAEPVTREGFPDPNVRRTKRWHCPAHVAQAQRGDMDPPSSGIGLDMRPLPDPDEVERERRRDAQLAEQLERRREERALVAREAREVDRIRDERFEQELFGGRSG